MIYNNLIEIDLFGLYGSQLNTIPTDSTFTLTSPINQTNFSAILGTLPFKISGCIIPGIDVRLKEPKICQDCYSVVHYNSTIIRVLCDGHGADGHSVAEFAVKYIEKYFKKHYSNFRADPKSMSTKVMQKCDKKILEAMDCDLSGTTAIFLMIEKGVVYCGSLGDSRAIVGYLSTSPETAVLRPNKFFRKIKCDRGFRTAPLSLDQKPEHSDEVLRIRNSGGIVEKYTDAAGRNVGPYRVRNRMVLDLD